MEFKHATLANGLEVIAEINPRACSTAIGFFVRTGSRDETPEVAGVSHFLEHMLFKGTPRRTPLEVNRLLDEMGGISNAFTSEEMTVYYAVVLPELQTRMVDLLTDLLRPSLREEDFNTEKNVILEEIKMYEDRPPFGLDEKYRELFFGSHPLAKSVLGTSGSVSALTVDQMRNYFQSRYAPDNIVAAVSGNVDFDLFVRDIEERTQTWIPSSPSRESYRPKGQKGTHIFTRPQAQQEYIYQVYDAPSVQDCDRYDAAILANIIGDDCGSRLFWELVDNGKADSAAFAYSDFFDTGCYVGLLCCAPEDAAENLKIFNQVLTDVQSHGITHEELERAKTKILSGMVLANERPGGRLFAIGAEWLQNRRYSPIQEDIEIVKGMTLEKIRAILDKYPIIDPMIAAIGPMKESDF